MAKRIRAVGVVIYNNHILLMWRKNSKEYYVFPGGGKEANESIEGAVQRELLEETSIVVHIEKLLYHLYYDNDTEQYFYLCSYVSGEPKLEANSPEKEEMQQGINFYDPRWIAIEKIKGLLLYPLDVRDLLLEDMKNNFQDKTKEFHFKIADRREK